MRYSGDSCADMKKILFITGMLVVCRVLVFVGFVVFGVLVVGVLFGGAMLVAVLRAGFLVRRLVRRLIGWVSSLVSRFLRFRQILFRRQRLLCFFMLDQLAVLTDDQQGIFGSAFLGAGNCCKLVRGRGRAVGRVLSRFRKGLAGTVRDHRGLDQRLCKYFFQLGQIGSRVDTEIIHESLGSGIDQGFARHFFIPAGYDDEFFFQEFLYGVVAAHAADGLDLPLGDRLLVGNDGQRLQCCRGVSFEEFFPVELGDGLMKISFGKELPTAAAFSHFEGIEFGGIFFYDPVQGSLYLLQGKLFLHKAEAVVAQLGDLPGR